MSSSKYLIAEQVLNRLKGGRPDQANKIDIRDIQYAIGQAVNERLGGTYLSVTLPSGETIPDGCMLATFEDVAVEEWKNRSRAKLPVLPVGLMRGIGIYEVTDPENPNCVYIPVAPGQFHMVADQDMLNSALPTYMYTQYGQYIEFNDVLDCVDKLLLRLVVSDCNNLGVLDVLPMPADWEASIVDTVYKRFAVPDRSDEKTDVLTENIAK